MLTLGLAGFVLIFALMCYTRYFVLKARGKNTDYDAGGNIVAIVSFLIVIIGFIASGCGWYHQISSFENVQKFRNMETIYQAKADTLTTEFADHLAEAYPEHERDIYDKISPNKVSTYLARYPDLRASDTLVELVDHINKLQSDVYDQQINAEEVLKETRVRLRDPWLYTFMIPKE